ncbi:amidohydrolase family protein [Streptomyces sp. NPDC049954]|uniref:amidohydrolase family protein n=1 Tax=Streptomyces sp. NPDC049954 TaxID=3155779 RepID=UPI0034145251
MADLILRNARPERSSRTVDIAVTDGLVSALGPALPQTAAEEIECAGRVVLPGLIESHLHLDKALLDERRPNPDGSLDGAISVTGELKKGFTASDVRTRARTVVERAVTHGTTLIRAHPDVDPIVGLLGVDVLTGLREEYRDVVDLQIVAFPQEGILRAPGTLELLREAMRRGADVVGGCSYNEATAEDCRRHVDLVFQLAREFGAPVDIHADFADDASDPRYDLAGYIADTTRETGWSGRVALGHMTALGGRPPAERSVLLRSLAEAGVAVVPLPATDVFLGGRRDDTAVRRGVAPVRELWEHGVTTAYSSNNIRNAFTPYGTADLLDVGLFLAQTGHLSGAEDLARVVHMATHGAASVVGVADRYGLRPGAAADLVVLDTTRFDDVLLDRPARLYVLKSGRVVARTRTTTELLHH